MVSEGRKEPKECDSLISASLPERFKLPDLRLNDSLGRGLALLLVGVVFPNRREDVNRLLKKPRER